METKLTLRLKKSVIERAKKYAEEHNISLSRMIEYYLESLTSKKKEPADISPLVESLSGVIKHGRRSDGKKEYSEYLNKKYK